MTPEETLQWLRKHPYADNTGLADQLADQVEGFTEADEEPIPYVLTDEAVALLREPVSA